MKPDIWDRAPGGLSPKCIGNGKIFVDQDLDGNIVIDNGDKILGVLPLKDLNRVLTGIRFLKGV